MRDNGKVLLVDPDRGAIAMFEDVLKGTGRVEVCTDFVAARNRLLGGGVFDLLVTNVRLDEYNGLHLVHVAAALGLPTRCIVYSDHHDPLLIREARAAGAVYESKQGIRRVVASYANATPSAHGEGSPLVEGLQPPQRDRRYAGARG
jgi:DNA-binding NtrC family response regulator